jgi:hypothetical protein
VEASTLILHAQAELHAVRLQQQGSLRGPRDWFGSQFLAKSFIVFLGEDIVIKTSP